jgi:hypothetical protein
MLAQSLREKVQMMMQDYVQSLPEGKSKNIKKLNWKEAACNSTRPSKKDSCGMYKYQNK